MGARDDTSSGAARHLLLKEKALRAVRERPLRGDEDGRAVRLAPGAPRAPKGELPTAQNTPRTAINSPRGAVLWIQLCRVSWDKEPSPVPCWQNRPPVLQSICIKTPRGRLPSGCHVMDSVVPGQARQKLRPLVFTLVFKLRPPCLASCPLVLLTFNKAAQLLFLRQCRHQQNRTSPILRVFLGV